MKVVCVDDESEFLENLVDILQAKGFEVRGFTNGFLAAKEMEINPPDIVITDMKMPGVHGLMMLFTTQQLVPNAHIVVLSGNTREDSEKAYEGKIDTPFFLKPMSDEFFEHLNSIQPVAGEQVQPKASLDRLQHLAEDYASWQKGLYAIAQESYDFYDFSGNFTDKYGQERYEEIEKAKERFERGLEYLCDGNSDKREQIKKELSRNSYTAAKEIYKNWRLFLRMESSPVKFESKAGFQIDYIVRYEKEPKVETKRVFVFEDISITEPEFLMDGQEYKPTFFSPEYIGLGVLEMAKIKNKIIRASEAE